MNDIARRQRVYLAASESGSEIFARCCIAFLPAHRPAKNKCTFAAVYLPIYSLSNWYKTSGSSIQLLARVLSACAAAIVKTSLGRGLLSKDAEAGDPHAEGTAGTRTALASDQSRRLDLRVRSARERSTDRQARRGRDRGADASGLRAPEGDLTRREARR